jgi:transcription elongation factor Elf1
MSENIEIRQNENKFKCNICGRRYKKRIMLNKHTNLRHKSRSEFDEAKIARMLTAKPNTFNCNICNKIFHTWAFLREHMRHEHDVGLGELK